MSLVVETDRLVLRALAEADRAEFVRVEVEGREHFAPWMPRREPISDDEMFDRQLARLASSERDGSELRRAVFSCDDKRLVGFVNLTQIFRGPFQSCYMGWRVAADVLRKGYGTEMVGGMLDAAFAPEGRGLGLHRVQANIVPTNELSLRLAERVGFRREGVALRYLEIAGEWADHVMLAKTVEEHEVRRM